MELKGIEYFRKGTQLRQINEDPTLLSFFMLFNTKSYLLDPEGPAIQYLRETIGGDDGNKYADRLEHFQKLLMRINREMPWFFQEIEGLDTTLTFDKMSDPYWGNDKMIEITCLEENIELMGNSLMTLYRAACFDLDRWVEILPRKLRTFDVDIFVTEVRTFQQKITDREKDSFGKIPQGTELTDNGNIAPVMSVDAKPYIHVQLGHCEWDMDSGKEILAGLSKNPEMKKSKLKFSYSSVRFPSYKGGMNLGPNTIDDIGIPEKPKKEIPDAYNPNATLDGSDVKDPNKLQDSLNKSGVSDSPIAEATNKPKRTVAGKLGAAVNQAAGNKMRDLKNRALGSIRQVTNAIDSFTNLGGALGNAHGDVLGGFAGQLLNNTIDSATSKLFLDNVYGVDITSTIRDAITQGSINGLGAPGSITGKPAGKKLSKDNVYDAFAADSDYLSKDNVYDGINTGVDSTPDGNLNDNVHE